jgi:hypothetical protein
LTLVAASGRIRETILLSPVLAVPGSNSVPFMVQPERSRATFLFAVCIAERRADQPFPLVSARLMFTGRGTGSLSVSAR